MKTVHALKSAEALPRPAESRRSPTATITQAGRGNYNFSEPAAVTEKSKRDERPELSVEERALRDRIKEARKLRWIGPAQFDAEGKGALSLPSVAEIFKANFKREAPSRDR